MADENTDRTVLVVDDQPVNIKLLKIKLEREGYTVIEAENGQECLDRVAECKPDLILLDIMMPVMDGLEACRRLKSEVETAAIPVIFITAKVTRDSRIEGLDAGALDYITKPIDLDETMARVRAHIRMAGCYEAAAKARVGVEV